MVTNSFPRHIRISVFCRRYSEPQKGFRILAYHTVRTPIKEDIRNLFIISSELLETHMAELSQYMDTPIIGPADTLNKKQKQVIGSGIVGDAGLLGHQLDKG